ncbi:MAG: hypothetical protein KIH63_001615 [Candidatus Saccharibacteria bacterium]|nr:hypothetical protein [Candidatus Saccharibacteria bacterium]
MAGVVFDPFEGLTPLFPELLQLERTSVNSFDAIDCLGMVGLDTELESRVVAELFFAQRAGVEVPDWHISEPLPQSVVCDPKADGLVNAVGRLDQWHDSWNSRPPDSICGDESLARKCLKVCINLTDLP